MTLARICTAAQRTQRAITFVACQLTPLAYLLATLADPKAVSLLLGQSGRGLAKRVTVRIPEDVIEGSFLVG